MNIESLALNLGFISIAIGMWKLGKGDPKGFLYQATGAFVMALTGFFLAEGGVPITVWNVVFGLVGVAGYRRIKNNEGL